MTRHVEHIVNAPCDGEVAGLGITNGTITRQVVLALEVIGVVTFLEALGVAPNRANHRGPRFFHHQNAGLSVGHVFASFIHDGGINAGERQSARTGHHRRGARQWRDHVAAGFSLPKGVNDGTTRTTHMLVVPLPSRRVDGFAHRAQQAQAA